jgi:hypothetical protein
VFTTPSSSLVILKLAATVRTRPTPVVFMYGYDIGILGIIEIMGMCRQASAGGSRCAV